MVKATDLHTNRGLQADLPTSYATYVDRWAIVVGVSKYKDGSINLKYADRDAEALYELLKTPSGGGFEEAHICKLVNEEATTANITRALRSFLKKPGKDDIVLLYFACHGAPDIDRPKILYLLTHDTDPKDIAGTALPMREINLSLSENLSADRVIIIADTCHSAGISKGNARDVVDNSGAINLYLQEAGATQKGIALLTSAEKNQVSLEDEKWGGGHGVFTHFLLEGMRGAADRNPKNGIVTVGELFEYVRENVKRETDDKQHPCIGPDSFDRNLPMAITAGISAQEHYELGCQLYQIALKLDDGYCFESASRHLREAIRQAAVISGKLPEAHLQLGLALTASGNLPKEAITAFNKAIKANIPDADYYLGIDYLNQGEVAMARQHLEAFLSKQPDSDKANTVQELISWLNTSDLSSSSTVKRYALLIGINYSKLDLDQLRPHEPLQGCINDIEILNEVLSQKYSFEVKMLSDVEATYENIVNAFRELQELSSFGDVVVIHYSGHEDGGSWLAADTKLDEKGDRLNIINTDKLYHLIDAIPALNKYLIMDIVVSKDLESFILQVNQTRLCTLLLGASLGQSSYELNIENTQKRHGYFTYTLVQQLWQASEEVLQRDLFEQVKEIVQTKFSNQIPFFLGDRDKPLFFVNPERYAKLFAFSQRRCYSAFDDRSLQILHQKVRSQFTTVFPDFYYSLGLAFLEKGDDAQALASLKTAVEYTKEKLDEKIFDLGVAQFNNRLYKDVSQSFQRCLKITTQETQNNLLNDVVSVIDKFVKSECCALLIGIDNYLGIEAVKLLGGVVSDAFNFQNVLVEQLGFQPKNIKVLLNQDATYQNIITAFTELVENSQISPTIFYFAGLGSANIEDCLTILAFDSRNGAPDILLAELAQLANQRPTNLVSIIDSSWSIGGSRYTDWSETALLASRKLVPVPILRILDLSKIPSIGDVSIYSESVKYLENRTAKEGQTYYNSSFTADLTTFLSNYQTIELPTYQVLKDFCDEKKIYFTSGTDILKEPIFSNVVLRSNIRYSLVKLENEPVQHAVLILRRLIEQRNGVAPEELFNLGIAYYRTSEYDKSITALQSALDQVSTQTTEGQPTSQRSYPEAHYWLGRVLYESKRDPARAVSELRLATQQSPDNSAAHYYLGKALRALVEQEILTEAERAFQAYLNAGAPLGQQEEVQEFFKSRKR